MLSGNAESVKKYCVDCKHHDVSLKNVNVRDKQAIVKHNCLRKGRTADRVDVVTGEVISGTPIVLDCKEERTMVIVNSYGPPIDSCGYNGKYFEEK